MNQLFQARTKKLMTAPVLARPKGELDVTKQIIVDVTQNKVEVTKMIMEVTKTKLDVNKTKSVTSGMPVDI